METLEAVRRQIQSVHDLQSVVKTMKGLAAVNIRQYEQAARALADYTRGLELGMQILMQRVPQIAMASQAEPPGRLAAVVLGSDQGMCGQFNSRMVAHASERLRSASPDAQAPLILAVGARATAELEASRHRVAESLHLPGSVTEITRRVEELVLRINGWREERGVRRVWLFHQRPQSGASYRPHFAEVIPLSSDWLRSLRARPWPSRMLPTFTMDWRELLSALIQQYLFAVLYRALAESLAAENAARLASMQAAEKNVDERLDELTAQYHRRRQNTITEELLDVSAGFEVLRRGGS
jgi:F-type H+-transporting ATPase subunit gamma